MLHHGEGVRKASIVDPLQRIPCCRDGASGTRWAYRVSGSRGRVVRGFQYPRPTHPENTLYMATANVAPAGSARFGRLDYCGLCSQGGQLTLCRHHSRNKAYPGVLDPTVAPSVGRRMVAIVLVLPCLVP